MLFLLALPFSCLRFPFLHCTLLPAERSAAASPTLFNNTVEQRMGWCILGSSTVAIRAVRTHQGVRAEAGVVFALTQPGSGPAQRGVPSLWWLDVPV